MKTVHVNLPKPCTCDRCARVLRADLALTGRLGLPRRSGAKTQTREPPALPLLASLCDTVAVCACVYAPVHVHTQGCACLCMCVCTHEFTLCMCCVCTYVCILHGHALTFMRVCLAHTQEESEGPLGRLSSPGWAGGVPGGGAGLRTEAPEEVSLPRRATWAEAGIWDQKEPSHGRPLLTELQDQPRHSPSNQARSPAEPSPPLLTLPVLSARVDQAPQAWRLEQQKLRLSPPWARG